MDQHDIIPIPRRRPLTGNKQETSEPDRAQILSIDRVSYRTARSRADFVGAFQLLQRRYVDAGLSSGGEKELRVLPYHLWNETQVFVAVHRRNVIGSVSLIRDGNRGGIPMESSYYDVVARLRDEGARIGEVSSLSVDSPDCFSSGDLFGQLTRIMMFHARHVGLEYLIAVVHPRHAKFYQRAMGFQQIGDSSPYRQVGGQLGIPVLGRVNDSSQYRPRWKRFYFDGHFFDGELDPRPMTQADREFFRRFLAPDRSVSIRRVA